MKFDGFMFSVNVSLQTTFVDKFVTRSTFGFFVAIISFMDLYFSGKRKCFTNRFCVIVFIEISNFSQIGFCSPSDSLVSFSSFPIIKKAKYLIRVFDPNYNFTQNNYFKKYFCRVVLHVLLLIATTQQFIHHFC